MGGLSLWSANLVSALSPQTRLFAARARLYRRAGVDVGPRTKVSGTTRIHYPNVSIGADTWVGAGCDFISSITARISIGRNCDIGPGVMFVVGGHEIGPANRRAGAGRSLSITVGDGCWIGARVTMIGGSALGNGSIAAAGALIRDQFPDDVLVAGTPARVIRQLSQDGTASSIG